MTRQPPGPGDDLTVIEAAADLRLDKKLIYHYVHTGQLEHYRYPGITGDGTIRIPRAEIERFRAACKRPAQGRTA